MGRTIALCAADGHVLDAYLAEPVHAPRGAIVLLQEFFGVNAHIRRVADDHAQRGYIVVAPAIFDRIERGVALAYDTPGMQRGRALRAQLNQEETLLDLDAAIRAAGERHPVVAAVGYCWGGVLAYLASLRLDGLRAVVAYYGATIPEYIDEPTRTPILLHFAGYDEYMKPDDPEHIAARHPEIELYVYPGTEHGFNCDERRFFDRAAAELALSRTLAFLERHLAEVPA